MNDAEFRRRVIEAMNMPVSDAEAGAVGAQCADDLAVVYRNRIDDIIQKASLQIGWAEHNHHHLIKLTERGYMIAHPIQERLSLDTLFDCEVTWTAGDVGVYGIFVMNWDVEQYDWVLGERIS